MMYQHRYVQQMQIILLVPEYGMTDIHSLVGDWLVLVGLVGFSWLLLVARIIRTIILLFRKPVGGNSFGLIFGSVFCKLNIKEHKMHEPE